MPDSRRIYISVLRLLIQLVILAITNWILTELPMIKAIIIPGLPITIPAIISLIIGIIAVVIILLFRRDFVPMLRTGYPNFPQAGTIVSEAITLAIIVIAYTMFEGSIKPLMRQLSWLYPVIFLAVALWPLYMLISTLYRSSGPIADWASTRLAAERTAITGDMVKCTSCGKLSPHSARFCTSCGTPAGPIACDSKCAACGTTNRQQDKYCLNCGALIDENDQYDTRVSI